MKYVLKRRVFTSSDKKGKNVTLPTNIDRQYVDFVREYHRSLYRTIGTAVSNCKSGDMVFVYTNGVMLYKPEELYNINHTKIKPGDLGMCLSVL